MDIQGIDRLYQRAQSDLSAKAEEERRSKAAEQEKLDETRRELTQIIEQKVQDLSAAERFALATAVWEKPNNVILGSRGPCSQQDSVMARMRILLLAAHLGHKKALEQIVYLAGNFNYAVCLTESERKTIAVSDWIWAALSQSAPPDGETIQLEAKHIIAWLETGAAKKDPDSIFALAEAYFLGRGVKKDVETSHKLHTIAAALGHSGSKTRSLAIAKAYDLSEESASQVSITSQSTSRLREVKPGIFEELVRQVENSATRATEGNPGKNASGVPVMDEPQAATAPPPRSDTPGLNIAAEFEPADKISAVQPSPLESNGASGGPEVLRKMTAIVERFESLESRFVNSLGRMESLLESLALERGKLDAASDLIRQQPVSLGAEIEELRSLLRNAAQQVSMAEPDRISPAIPKVASSSYASFPQLLQGLIEIDGISLAEFRRHLLPLDLLPSAVIEETNERALDLVGELALEEVGDEIVVVREILVAVLANWRDSSASEGIES